MTQCNGEEATRVSYNKRKASYTILSSYTMVCISLIDISSYIRCDTIQESISIEHILICFILKAIAKSPASTCHTLTSNPVCRPKFDHQKWLH